MIYITEHNDGLLVQGDEISRHYPYEGVLTIPKNSTLLVMDDSSDMVVFKSASNYDTWFTAIIGNIYIGGVLATKDNIVELFNDISNDIPKRSGGIVVPGGDGSEIIVDCDLEEVNRKLDKINKYLQDMDCALDKINGEEICGYLPMSGCSLLDEINGCILDEDCENNDNNI